MTLLKQYGKTVGIVLIKNEDDNWIVEVTYETKASADQAEFFLTSHLETMKKKTASMEQDDFETLLDSIEELSFNSDHEQSREEKQREIQKMQQNAKINRSLRPPLTSASTSTEVSSTSNIKYDNKRFGVQIPYGVQYDEVIEKFHQYGPLDYYSYIAKPHPTKKFEILRHIAYFDNNHAKAAYYNSQEYKPRRVEPFILNSAEKENPELIKMTCPLCESEITRRFRMDHVRYCAIINKELKKYHNYCKQEILIKNWFAHAAMCTEEDPLPINQIKEANYLLNKKPINQRDQKEAMKNTEIEEVKFIKSAKMQGPLVGWRQPPTAIKYITHRKTAVTILDEGQQIIEPELANLESQLKKIYGETNIDFN